jgi:non-specific serine/threonine protein kinase/serine/threonine-protein kinase
MALPRYDRREHGVKRERWQQVKQLLDQAIALDSVERQSFLERTCQGDAELRREVESLLWSHDRAGAGFLEEPAVRLSGAAAATASPVRERRLGAYQLAEEIAHGGMGEVYRAVRADGQFTKEVAIKVVRSGLESSLLAERFRRERQILASLEHPNIARLLDGGATDDGIPYLVMELIAGVPIDQYCDDHTLSVNERLQLFRQVCSAVQYAHQHLVIHRDIKPSNILVDVHGVPKLLDFSIAKLLDPGDTSATMLRAMTPEYASPEQIRGEPITTATDVYSLGVVLYLLLTGRSPYPGDTSTPHGLARAICDDDPIRPSIALLKQEESRQARGMSPAASIIRSKREASPAKLRKRLDGDLDNVVLRALHKEPSLRYASVEQLSNDLHRYLDGLPVTARQDSWAYRTGKFAKRHKLGLAAAVLISLALLAGGIATLREARIAAAHEQRAQKRFNDVRKLGNSLIFEIHDSIRDLPGSTAARQLIVNRSLEYLDDLSKEATGDVALQRELAAAYMRVGDVLGYPYAPNLGDKPGALKSYQKALVILEPLAGINPGDTKLQADLTDCYSRVANVLEAEGDFANGLISMERVLAIMQRVTALDKDPKLMDRLAGGYYFRAELLGRMGNNEGALENYQQAASIREAALRANPSLGFLCSHLGADYAGLALAMRNNGDIAQAIEEQNKAVGILEELSRTLPNNAVAREYLGEGVNRLAEFRLESGDVPGALGTAKRSHDIFGELLQADPKNSLAKTNFGFADLTVAGCLLGMDKPTSASKVLEQAAATFEELSARDAGDRYVRTGLALSYSGLGRAHSALAAGHHLSKIARQDEWRQARAWYQKGLSVWAEKNRRGEVESAERYDQRRTEQGMERCNRALAASPSKHSE